MRFHSEFLPQQRKEKKSNLKLTFTRFCCKMEDDIELNNLNFHSELQRMCEAFGLPW